MRTAVVVAGSSGSGKTTAVRLLREVMRLDRCLSKRVSFPCRYTTRTRRIAEDAEESLPIPRSEFMEMQERGMIDVVWSREIAGAWVQPELYGFRTEAAEVAILSGNNALIRSIDAVYAVYDRVRVLVVEASPEVRLMRLLLRSPEMSAAERLQRTADHGEDVRKIADAVINTDEQDFLAVATQTLKEVSRLLPIPLH